MDQRVERISVSGMVNIADAHEDIIDSFDRASLPQVELVGEGQEHVFHVLSDLADQVQPLFEELLEHGSQVAFVSIALAPEACEHAGEHLLVVVCYIGWREQEAYQLLVFICHQVQLEAKEPAGGGLASLGDAVKDAVLVNPAVVADGQLLGVDVVMATAGREAAAVLGQEKGMEAGRAHQGEELGIGNGSGEVAVQLSQNQTLIEVLKALEA